MILLQRKGNCINREFADDSPFRVYTSEVQIMPIYNRELIAALEGQQALCSCFEGFCSLLETQISTTKALSSITIEHEESSNEANITLLGNTFKMYFDVINHEHRFLGVLNVVLLNFGHRISDPEKIYQIYFDQQGNAFEDFSGVGSWEELGDARFAWNVLYRISKGYFQAVRKSIGYLYKE